MDNDTKDLIRQAFEKARQSGKPGWHRMTIAVLKNRLIQITKKPFKEADYGARNMVELLEQAPDLVKLDISQFPPVVELVTAQGVQEEVATHSLQSERIRPDLWQAVMDYSSGNQYVWDVERAVARERIAGDATAHLFPTITPEEDAKWRKEFAEQVGSDVTGFGQARLAAFVAHSVSPTVLPRQILTKWNEFVKARIVDTLTRWFDEQHIQPPEKFVVTIRRPPRVAPPNEVEQLRDLVIACVKQMTQQELLSISLPPLAVLRARKDKGASQ